MTTKTHLVFAGRKHHAEKLFPQYLALDSDGAARWIISNNSINIDPSSEFIYSYARDRSSVIHLYDNVSPQTLGRISNQYSKLAKKVLDRKVIDSVSPFWVLQGLREAIEVDYLSQDLYKNMEPASLLVLHTNNFWGRILAKNAQNVSIPVFAFQEGMLRDLDQETMNKQSLATDYVHTMFVWTESDKEKYESSGANCNIVVSGPMHLDYAIRTLPQKENKRQQLRQEHGIDKDAFLVGLALPLTSHYHGDIVQDIKDLARWAFIYGYHLVIRPHPFDKDNFRNINEALGVTAKSVLMDNDWSVAKFLMGNNVVLGQHSTIGLESVIVRTPFFEFGRGENEVLESKQYANYIDLNNISEYRKEDFTNGEEVANYCQDFLDQNEDSLSGYAAIKVRQEIERVTAA